MRVLILAGGKGTRMGNLTIDIPKPMVKLAGKPILEYQIELLKNNNLKDISILTGYKGDIIESYFQNGERWGVNIDYFVDPKPLGTSGSIKEIEGHIPGSFLLLYGDTMIDINLIDLISFHQKQGGIATLVVHPNDHPHDSDLLDICVDNRVTEFYSKPHLPGVYHRNLVNAALYVAEPEIFNYIEKGISSDFGKDIFPKLVSLNKPLFAYNTTEYIKDIGTIERLKEVEEDYISGKVSRSNKSNKQKAVFIDRDGVINSEAEPLDSPDKFKFLPDVKDAIKLLNKSDYLSVVVTNQPIIAKGFASEKQVLEVHNYMEYVLGKEGCYLDRIYYCPHHPEKGYKGEIKEFKIDCSCRKPATGMIDKAAQEMNIDLTNSFIIGDRTVDIMTGKNANLITILVRQGFAGEDRKFNCTPDFIFENLLEASQFIVNGFEKLRMIVKEAMLYKILEGDTTPIIAVGGLSRSGKSTLSSVIRILIEQTGKKVKTLKLDNWLIPNNQRDQTMNVRDRYRYKSMENDIEDLLSGKPIIINRYDPQTRGITKNVDEILLNNEEVLLIEGVVALDNEYIREKANLRIYTQVSEELRIKRFNDFYRYKNLSKGEIDILYNARIENEVNIIELTKVYADNIVNMDF